jgi:hypothetical protein
MPIPTRLGVLSRGLMVRSFRWNGRKPKAGAEGSQHAVLDQYSYADRAGRPRTDDERAQTRLCYSERGIITVSRLVDDSGCRVAVFNNGVGLLEGGGWPQAGKTRRGNCSAAQIEREGDP